MFEREFEIIIPQDFELCLERIDNLKKQNWFRKLFNPIDSFIYPREADAEFVMRQALGQHAGYAVIKGRVEALEDGTTRVSGLAKLEGIVFILIFFSLIALAFIVQDIMNSHWWFLAFTAVWYPLAMYQQIYFRNRLINTLKKTLRQ